MLKKLESIPKWGRKTETCILTSAESIPSVVMGQIKENQDGRLYRLKRIAS